MDAKNARNLFGIRLLLAAVAIFAFALGAERASARGPEPEPAPPNPFKIVNFSHYTDLAGALHIVGEVVNQGPKPTQRVEVGAYLYNARNKQIAVNYAYSCIDVLAPGARSTFDVGFQDPPAAAKRYDLSATGFLTTAPASTTAFQVSPLKSKRDAQGIYHITGTVKNVSQKTYSGVELCTGVYNPQGKVIRASYAFSEPATLEPGKSGKFDWQIYEDDYPEGTGLKLKAVAHGLPKK